MAYVIEKRGGWGGQIASTSFNISDNTERKLANVEWLLKQSLNALKLILHRFNLAATCFYTVERRGGGGGGGQTVSASLFSKIERMLKQMMRPFALLNDFSLSSERNA